MQRILTLFSISLLSLAGCDDSDSSLDPDRTAELAPELVEDGWFVDAEGSIVRDGEDGEVEVGRLAAVDTLVVPSTNASTNGVWKVVSTEWCLDLVQSKCTGSKPTPQRKAGTACTKGTGAAWQVLPGAYKVNLLNCV